MIEYEIPKHKGTFMKISLILSVILAGIPALAPAEQTGNSPQLGVQAVIATGGSIGMGPVRYTEHTEMGLTVAGTIDNADAQTKLFVPDIFGGWRKALGEKTYFATGLDVLGKFGRDAGEAISADYLAGPYISVEQYLTPHLLLGIWVDPYTYEYADKAGTKTSTNNIFSNGGLGISYLF
jgi:hypothetical protein